MSTLLTAAAVLVLAGQCQHTFTPDYILTIAQGESLIHAGPNAGMFDAAAVSPVNRNGTRDYGLMQINSGHLAAWNLTPAAALDPCLSIALAEQVLRQFSQYNSGKPTGSLEYAKAAYLRLRSAAAAAQPASTVPPPPPPELSLEAHPDETGGELIYGVYADDR